jgi:hypothetical protein
MKEGFYHMHTDCTPGSKVGYPLVLPHFSRSQRYPEWRQIESGKWKSAMNSEPILYGEDPAISSEWPKYFAYLFIH